MKTKLLKRIASLAMAITLLFAFSITAFADNEDNWITNSVSVPSGSTVKFVIGKVPDGGGTGTFKITSSGSDSNQTLSWSVSKGANPAFMSGNTYVNAKFEKNNYYLAGGTYYITVTNNSSRAATVTATFIWSNLW